MIFIIISNIGLALMTILVYMRYSHFRVSYGNKIKELQKSLKETKAEKEENESKLDGDYKKENEQVKNLLRELEQARKERQDEIKMRMEAEKEIEVSKEKIIQVQKRVDDWKKLQEGAINDSKDLIMNFGNDLIDKINKTHKEEEDRTRNFFEENVRSIENNVNTLHKEIGGIDSRIVDFRKKVSQAITSSRKELVKNSSSNAAAKTSDSEEVQSIDDQDINEEAKEVSAAIPKAVKLDEIAQKAMKDVISLADASGLKHMKDYVVASQLDDEKSKYMLCDLFLIVKGVGYVIDFKADRFFVDYMNKVKEGEEKAAEDVLKSRFDKYLAYIGNPKYISLIKKFIAAMKIQVKEVKLVCALKSYDDLRVIAKIGYNDKIDKMNIELMDVNAVNDLIL